MKGNSTVQSQCRWLMSGVLAAMLYLGTQSSLAVNQLRWAAGDFAHDPPYSEKLCENLTFLDLASGDSLPLKDLPPDIQDRITRLSRIITSMEFRNAVLTDVLDFIYTAQLPQSPLPPGFSIALVWDPDNPPPPPDEAVIQAAQERRDKIAALGIPEAIMVSSSIQNTSMLSIFEAVAQQTDIQIGLLADGTYVWGYQGRWAPETPAAYQLEFHPVDSALFPVDLRFVFHGVEQADSESKAWRRLVTLQHTQSGETILWDDFPPAIKNKLMTRLPSGYAKPILRYAAFLGHLIGMQNIWQNFDNPSAYGADAAAQDLDLGKRMGHRLERWDSWPQTVQVDVADDTPLLDILFAIGTRTHTQICFSDDGHFFFNQPYQYDSTFSHPVYLLEFNFAENPAARHLLPALNELEITPEENENTKVDYHPNGILRSIWTFQNERITNLIMMDAWGRKAWTTHYFIPQVVDIDKAPPPDGSSAEYASRWTHEPPLYRKHNSGFRECPPQPENGDIRNDLSVLSPGIAASIRAQVRDFRQTTCFRYADGSGFDLVFESDQQLKWICGRDADNKPDGQCITFHPNGRPRLYMWLQDGKLRHAKTWMPNGEPEAETTCYIPQPLGSIIPAHEIPPPLIENGMKICAGETFSIRYPDTLTIEETSPVEDFNLYHFRDENEPVLDIYEGNHPHFPMEYGDVTLDTERTAARIQGCDTTRLIRRNTSGIDHVDILMDISPLATERPQYLHFWYSSDTPANPFPEAIISSLQILGE